MSFRWLFVASCLFVVLPGAISAQPAKPPAPKDGPLGMKFVPLPKATFYMGWDGTKGSAKKTEIKEDFEIAVHTVTQGQWQKVMGKNPSYFFRAGMGRDKVKDIKDEDLKHFPVENVSWNDAQAFIKKLNEQEKGKGYRYRLPNEVEWEYACRGGATSEEECSYHFYFAKPTDDLSSREAKPTNVLSYEDANFNKKLGRTTKVGSYSPNKLGLYDMHGNVWQWCEGQYDPKGFVRMHRGGDSYNGELYCRAGYRGPTDGKVRSPGDGFRLARVSVGDQPGKPAPEPKKAKDSPLLEKKPATEWVSLFNGKDLDGWTPKFTGHEPGVNYLDTFRVEDGVIKVAYDKYKQFGGKFGHLFYKDKFSHYDVRLEYRFLGAQAKGAPGWALRNSGLMFHCQSPQSMRKEQDFPVSIEFQFLGGNGKDKRPTGSMCSPGTNVVIKDKLITQHCVNSTSKTFHGEQWVKAELQVRGSGKVKHIINGEVVFEYEQPQLDPKDKDGAALIKLAGGKLLLEEGYIALQAESHPCEFRKIEVRVLQKQAKAKDGPLGMKFVPLPKATFYLGWDGDKKGKKTEIKEDFEIAVYTVTQSQWKEVMGKNPSYFSRAGKEKDKVKGIKDEELMQFPVENVSWEDAQEFIKKLNEKEKGRGYQYRLPSDAEWEYACRGGAATEEDCSYHFYFEKPTNDLSSTQANFNGNSPFGKGEKGPYLGRPTKVGSYAPNKLGLYDMHGNVWQWCEDLYMGSDRVLRGGCWLTAGANTQAANRARGTPAVRRQGNVGLRLARVPVGEKPGKPAPEPKKAKDGP